MKNFSNSLAYDLDQNLAASQKENVDSIELAEKAVQIVLECMDKLRAFVRENDFTTKSEEIEFFKMIKPHFSSKLIYYNTLYSIEVGKPSSGHKSVAKYYKQQENNLQEFYAKNLDFYKYYRTGNTTLDKKYFVRRKHDIKMLVDSYFFQADYNFCTSHDFLVAQIIANNEIQNFLEQSQIRLISPAQEIVAVPNNKQLKWTGSKVALVELLYAMHASQVINNGDVSLKSIAETAETLFNINLGQFNRIFLEIKARKSIERTSFLNTLKNNLERKIDETYKI